MRLQAVILTMLLAPHCTSGGLSDSGPAADARSADAGIKPADAALPDAMLVDGGSADAADIGAPDATPGDAGLIDASPADGSESYNCGAFSVDPGWTVLPGFRAVEIAAAAQGLSQPVAIAFAGAEFGNRLFVVDQGDNALRAVDVRTGTTTVVIAPGSWPVAARLLTTITWDATHLFDGNLYVGDQGTDADGDSRIFRVNPVGTATVFAEAPGPAMDDLYALVFADSSSYAPGLYVSGDTDGTGPDWARIDAAGQIGAFSEVAGVEGAVFDRGGSYGGKIIAARPLGGGYAGDGTITMIEPNGSSGPILASNLGGVHAVVLSPGGTFGHFLYAASWSAGQLLQVSPTGEVTVIASGLQLTNYDGNVLAFSPDGNVLYVADRSFSRVVCIEPIVP